MRPWLADPQHAIWLIPTPDFRRGAFARRDAGDAFWLRASVPQRALTNLLERDRMFTERVAADAENSGLATMHIDGSRTLDGDFEDLVARFKLTR